MYGGAARLAYCTIEGVICTCDGTNPRHRGKDAIAMLSLSGCCDREMSGVAQVGQQACEMTLWLAGRSRPRSASTRSPEEGEIFGEICNGPEEFWNRRIRGGEINSQTADRVLCSYTGAICALGEARNPQARTQVSTLRPRLRKALASDSDCRNGEAGPPTPPRARGHRVSGAYHRQAPRACGGAR